MMQQGLIEKVNTNAIKKGENKVRICGDYKTTINQYIEIDEHPLPTIEELFASMSGGQKFSKIDLTKAYLQLEVEEKSRKYLTLNTHKGLFRPTRLIYGVASAPAIWQRFMEGLLKDIEGVTVFIDDIKITGPNDKVHLKRLHEVMKRLNNNIMRINEEKCNFLQDKIEHCGYEIDANGIHKTASKIEAVENMPIIR